jgi:hypothetical protein
MFTKQFTCLMLLFCSLSFSLVAQVGVVSETERSMSMGARPCFRLEFSGAKDDLVLDVWKDFLKKQFNAKFKKGKNNEYLSASVKSSLIGSDPFNIIAVPEKSGDNAAITIWFDMGTYFLNRRDNARATDEATRILRSYYFDVRRAILAKALKMEEDKMKDLETKQRRLLKDNESLHKDIESYKAKIKKAEDDIVQNQRDQEATTADMEAQRRAIEAARDRMNNVENEKQ